MTNRHPRILQIVHAIPGRTRMRLSWLRQQPDEAAPLAERLAQLDASVEVRVRPWTGSVLVTYDPQHLDESALLAETRRLAGASFVVRRGEESPEARAEIERTARAGHGSLGRALGRSMREINRDVLEASDGRLDLGSLTGLSFLALGAAEIAATRTLPAPPWFNLAWWAFRTFTIFGGEEVDDTEHASDDDADAG